MIGIQFAVYELMKRLLVGLPPPKEEFKHLQHGSPRGHGHGHGHPSDSYHGVENRVHVKSGPGEEHENGSSGEGKIGEGEGGHSGSESSSKAVVDEEEVVSVIEGEEVDNPGESDGAGESGGQEEEGKTEGEGVVEIEVVEEEDTAGHSSNDEGKEEVE